MKIKRKPSRLAKRANRGFRGYPIATIAFYGEDDTRSSKVAVGILLAEDGDPAELETWASTDTDLRYDDIVGGEIIEFVKARSVLSVVMSPGIIGCPHEEGIDYPEGEVCPKCPFWAVRDRWTGQKLPQQ